MKCSPPGRLLGKERRDAGPLCGVCSGGVGGYWVGPAISGSPFKCLTAIAAERLHARITRRKLR